MRWIDEAAYACAASWSSEDAVAVYAGGIHFYRPIHIGRIVEVDAQMIRTGARSMHISVRVRSGSPLTPDNLQLTTQCMSIFVSVGADGRAEPIAALPLTTEQDQKLDAHARELMVMREPMKTMPVNLVRRHRP